MQNAFKWQSIVQPIVESLQLQYFGAEYIPQSGRALIRIYVETESGVSAEDCAQVSRLVNSAFSVEPDFIDRAYTLEVSSPGLDRPLFTLEHCTANIGKQIRLKTITALDGQQNFTGELVAVTGEQLVVNVLEKGELNFAFNAIERVRIVPQW